MPDTPDALPRPEYPRPQFVRENWHCLNGQWEFTIDHNDSGTERGLCALDAAYDREITVPFCPESILSGIEYVDFMDAVWYRRKITIPAEWENSDILVNFGAVDYDTTVWVLSDRTEVKMAAKDEENPSVTPSKIRGIEVGRHRGGWTSFTCNLRDLARPGETVTLIVRAREPARNVPIARGKQSTQYAPHACLYTRTTGIWQTVWMEPVPKVAALKRFRITPDVANSAFHLEIPLTQNRSGFHIRATLSDANGEVCQASARADLDFAPRLTLALPADRVTLWSIPNPHLYDLHVELTDNTGATIDALQSYAGLRSIAIDGKKINLNGETIFQRLVLDQGYYPEGVLTAPSDAALLRDIELSMEAGFNGARLHQKVFEERFLYHADRKGYLVWGEFADWGAGGYGPNSDHQQPTITYAAQWLEAIERDYSHPALIGWCGLNETHQPLHDRITNLDDATRALFLAAKALDTTRPVLDTSGYAHRITDADLYDSHYYIENKDFAKGLEKYRQTFGQPATEAEFDQTAYANPDAPTPTPSNANPTRTVWSVPYNGQPYFLSEYGGFKWNPNVAPKSATENSKDRKTSWGYGSDPETLEDFYTRLEATTHILMSNKFMFGLCYTQLTDVYPEENGIYTFDRKAKFDMARIRAIFQAAAAIEQATEEA